MSCERPFDCADTADTYKRRLCDRFKSLFSWTLVAAASAGPASVGHCVTPSNGPKGGTPPSDSSTSCNKLKKIRGKPTKVFDQNGFLTLEVTDKITDRMSGRTYLAENEIKLIHVLLSTYCNGDVKRKDFLLSLIHI